MNWTNPIAQYTTQFPRYTFTTSLPDNQSGRAYYWYAQPCYSNQCGLDPNYFVAQPPPSPVRAFQKIAKPVPQLSPAPGAVVTTNQVTFTWTGFLQTNQTGALADRMRAEVKRAARYGRNLSVLVLHLESGNGVATADMMARAVGIVTDSIRVDIDFATRYRGLDGVQRIAVVLPETVKPAAADVGVRLSGTLAAKLQTPIDSFTARVGCASFIPGEDARPAQQISASIEALLREAEAGARVAPLSGTSQRRNEAG